MVFKRAEAANRAAVFVGWEELLHGLRGGPLAKGNLPGPGMIEP